MVIPSLHKLKIQDRNQYEYTKNITERKRLLIFLNIVISCIASSMLSTALTAALPAIVADLKISVTTGQWLTSGYSLAMGVMMPLTAFLITRFPTRRLYLAGLLLSISGLVVCVIAPNFSVMMLARILQAGGNGILTAMSQVLILSMFPAENRGSAMGWYGLSVGAAPVIAPTQEGIIVDCFSWRAIFVLSLAVMAAALGWALAVFENILETAPKRFDALSFLLSALAFTGVTLGVGNIGASSFSIRVFFTLLTGVIAAILFTYRQLRLDEPFLNVRVLKSRSYALSVLGSMLLYFVMMGSSVIMPLYAQSILDLSATASGLIVLPGSLAMAAISPFVGRIYDRLGIRVLFIAGAGCLFAGCLGMLWITAQTPVLVAALLNVLRNVAIGCLMMPLVTWGTSCLSNGRTAHGTALLTSLRTISGAIGSAVFVGILTFASAFYADQKQADAMIAGLNVTFLCMAAVAFLLLLIGIFRVKTNAIEKRTPQYSDSRCK